MFLYKLHNTVTGKAYIGITIRPVKKRLSEHLGVAKRGKTTLIARALTKYGLAAFRLEILGQAESWEVLCAMEQAAIRTYNTFKPHGYNLTRGGDGTLGRLHTEVAKQRISAANTGKVHDRAFREKVSARFRGVPKSPVQRERMGAWQRGANNSQFGKTPKHHAKMLAAAEKARQEHGHPHAGKPLSPAHKAKLSAANTGRKMSEEHKAAMSALHKGKVVSEETRAKLRAATLRQLALQGNPMQGRTHTEKTKALISARHKGRPLTEATKAKMRGRTLTPAQRQALSEARKGRGRGSQNAVAKLTEAEVRTIRRLYKAGGTTHKKLAEQFHVSEQSILNIVRRKSWTHI